jgi:hypothetical protein
VESNIVAAPQMLPVNDVDRYNTAMRKSLIDKIFFLDKVDADLFIDFGCADGSMLKLCNLIFPEHEYIGYDKEHTMQAAFMHNCKGSENIRFVSDIVHLARAVGAAKNNGSKVCLVFSSVIHEVYHYGPKNVDEFWRTIWELEPDYVAIREMAVSITASRTSDPVAVARIRQCYDREKIAQWESRWGNLNENWSLIHFLLHYRYTEGWEREHRENYLPLNKEDLIGLIPKHYYPDYVEHYTLPFIRRTVFEDFGIQLQDPTHLKLILRRTE